MNPDLKRELERRISDSEIPPLVLESIKTRGHRLQWRRRAAITCSGLLGAMILVGAATMLMNGDQPVPPPNTADESVAAPDDDPVASLDPGRVRTGDRALLRVNRSPGIWGLAWNLERQEGSSWESVGGLVAGPERRWETRFYLGSEEPSIGVDDISFTEPAAMVLEVPELEPGTYRLGQDFVRAGQGSLEERTQRYYAEFEVLEGTSASLDDKPVSLDPDRVSVGDRAKLRIHRAPGSYGLPWKLERMEGSSWEWVGNLKAGPGKYWDKEFYIFPDMGHGYEDIGFNGPAAMVLEIPDLEPGRYRLGTEFIRGGRGSVAERTYWHYAEFEVNERRSGPVDLSPQP